MFGIGAFIMIFYWDGSLRFEVCIEGLFLVVFEIFIVVTFLTVGICLWKS